MRRLIPVPAVGDAGFVGAVQEIWDRGDAVAPFDPGAPGSHRNRIRAALRLADPVEDGDAVVIPTSGSSGEPKAAVLTHDAIEAAAFMTAAAVASGPGSRWLACLPLHHIGGFSVVTRALISGAGLEVHPRFDAALVEAAAQDGCTHTSLVATALGRIDASLFQRILLGGSAVAERQPPNVVATYGMTESGGGVVYDGLPLNGVRVRIRETEPGDPIGEILISSPTLLRCYRDGSDPRAEGWYPTGDLGWMDAATGELRVVGRADDLIKSGGEKVWPNDVEDVLRTSPGVADVAVVGHPDPEWGQRVVAIVVPSDRSEPPTLAEVRALVKAHLPPAAAPREVRIVSAIPRTSLGKIRRGVLRA